MNRVVLVGRLTRDPELRYTKENKAVATLIINKDLKGKEDREAARKAREETRKGKDSKKIAQSVFSVYTSFCKH